MPVWIGLAGAGQRRTATLAPVPGRSPHDWTGPDLAPGAPFALDVMLHPGLGQGGLLWRPGPGMPWTSLAGHSATGPECIAGSLHWSTGAAPGGAFPFLGSDLRVSAAAVPPGP